MDITIKKFSIHMIDNKAAHNKKQVYHQIAFAEKICSFHAGEIKPTLFQNEISPPVSPQYPA
ncbi:MAG: hypothetical protein WDM78_10585 [Puia sp.]